MRRVLIVVAVASAALVAAWWWSRRGDGVSSASARIGAAGGLAEERVRGELVARPPDAAQDALARAYAALGAADDAGAQARPTDDAVAAQARELLALDRAHRRNATPTTAPGTRLAVGGSPARTGDAAGGRVEVSTQAHATTAPSAGAARDATPDADVESSLAADAPLPDARAALRETPDGPVLRQPGLWADTRFRPDAMPRGLRVVDASGGGYAVRVVTDRPERLRLDGGLIVPGRYYRVNGASTLVGDAAAAVEIRPLAAVQVWHEAPPAPPIGPG